MAQGIHPFEGEHKFEVRDLTVRYSEPERPVLDQLSIDFFDKKINALIGPSGCGKSTLLRCLNRLTEPPRESVLLDGEDITQIPPLALRQRVTMVMQSASMFDGTVGDNINFGPTLRQTPLTKAEIESLLEQVHLDTSIIDKDATELSGGQAQRVSIARSLANKPEVLLLDEPTSALDPAATRKVEQTLQELRDALGLTIILVSHSIEQVQRIADVSALLLDGKVVESGTPEHLLSGAHQHLTESFAKGELA
jgi:ABC-type phosphate transport system ATPase subunit